MNDDSQDDQFPVESIEKMVNEFYARIQQDPELGPIFAKRVHDWPVHLERMVGFWRAVLRSERTFRPSPQGSPPILHRRIEELRLEHFDRWLSLFGEVVDDLFQPRAGNYIKSTATRIASALSRHLVHEVPESNEPRAK